MRSRSGSWRSPSNPGATTSAASLGNDPQSDQVFHRHDKRRLGIVDQVALLARVPDCGALQALHLCIAFDTCNGANDQETRDSIHATRFEKEFAS